MPFRDDYYGVSIDYNEFHSAACAIDVSFSGEEELVMSCRFTATASITIKGRSSEIDCWRVGFIQNVITPECIGYYGVQGEGGQKVTRTFKQHLRPPVRDAALAHAPWHSAPAGGVANPISPAPLGGNVVTRIWQARLADQPNASLEWELEGDEDLPLVKTGGRTTFQYFLVATRGKPDGTVAAQVQILDFTVWDIDWLVTVSDRANVVPKARVTVAPNGKCAVRHGAALLDGIVFGAPDANGNDEFVLSAWA